MQLSKGQFKLQESAEACRGGQSHFQNLTEGRLQFGLWCGTTNELATDSVVHTNPISSVLDRFEWQNLIYCNLDTVFTSLTQFPFPNNLIPSLPLSLLPNVHIPRAQKCWLLLFALHTDLFFFAEHVSCPQTSVLESHVKQRRNKGSDTLCVHAYPLMCVASTSLCSHWQQTSESLFKGVEKKITHRGENKSNKEIDRVLVNTMPLSNKPLFGKHPLHLDTALKYGKAIIETVSFQQLTLLLILICVKPSYLVLPETFYSRRKPTVMADFGNFPPHKCTEKFDSKMV